MIPWGVVIDKMLPLSWYYRKFVTSRAADIVRIRTNDRMRAVERLSNLGSCLFTLGVEETRHQRAVEAAKEIVREELLEHVRSESGYY